MQVYFVNEFQNYSIFLHIYILLLLCNGTNFFIADLEGSQFFKYHRISTIKQRLEAHEINKRVFRFVYIFNSPKPFHWFVLSEVPSTPPAPSLFLVQIDLLSYFNSYQIYLKIPLLPFSDILEMPKYIFVVMMKKRVVFCVVSLIL